MQVDTVALFEVVAEPHRRRILELLRTEARPVGALVDELGLSQPAVSKHLRVLRDAGLVEARTDAQHRIYRVRTDPLRAIDDWLAPFRAQWQQRLEPEPVADMTPQVSGSSLHTTA